MAPAPQPAAAIAVPTTNAAFHRLFVAPGRRRPPIPLGEREPRDGNDDHVDEPRRDDCGRDDIPLRVGQQRGDDDRDRHAGIGVLVQQASFCDAQPCQGAIRDRNCASWSGAGRHELAPLPPQHRVEDVVTSARNRSWWNSTRSGEANSTTTEARRSNAGLPYRRRAF